MALDEMYADSLKAALDNRQQLESITGSPPALEVVPPQNLNEWYEFGAVWLIVLAAMVALFIAHRGASRSVPIWIRRLLTAWVCVCLFGSLVSTREGSPDYSAWILGAAWPPLVILAGWALINAWRRRAT